MRRKQDPKRWALAAAAAGVVAAGCFERPSPPPTEVVAVRAGAVPETPADAAWKRAPVYTAALLPQDMVEPRLLQPTTPALRVQAVTDGARIAFRMAWTDSTRDDRPGVSRFTDACAVQLPTQHGPDLPAPQMGESGGRVAMVYWSADWQARIDGRPDSIQALYPNASVDHYPFAAPSLEPGSEAQRDMARRYTPARALGAGPRAGSSVQDLVAEGPGTITPASESRSTGDGRWQRQTWEVVIVCTLPEALRGQPRSQVAFAVWNGARGEVGARKMRSVWIPLSLGGES